MMVDSPRQVRSASYPIWVYFGIPLLALLVQVYLPLFHIVGLSWITLATLWAGGTIVLSPPPSVVVQSFAIPLGDDRDQERTRSDARFLELRNAIHHLIGRPRPASETAAV